MGEGEGELACGGHWRRMPATLVFCGYHWDTVLQMRVRAACHPHPVVFATNTRDPATRAKISDHARHGAFILPGFDHTVESVQRLVPDKRHLLAPPLRVMKAFEGRFAGKSKMTAWMHSHALGDYVTARYNLSNALFPLMLKPKRGTNGIGVRVVTNRTDLPQSLRRYFLEELLLNRTEWGVYFVARKGRVSLTRCVAFHFNTSSYVRNKKGNGFVSRTHPDTCPHVLDAFASRFVRVSNYTGFGCAGLKFHGGQPRLIEVNTRLCGVLLSATFTLRKMMTALLPMPPSPKPVQRRTAWTPPRSTLRRFSSAPAG